MLVCSPESPMIFGMVPLTTNCIDWALGQWVAAIAGMANARVVSDSDSSAAYSRKKSLTPIRPAQPRQRVGRRPWRPATGRQPQAAALPGAGTASA